MIREAAFNAERDIPDLTHRVILVTGGSNGLGKESARRFAQHGAKVILAGRNHQTATTTIKEIKGDFVGADISFLELDLASSASVNTGPQRFLAENSRLDILMNNGGIMVMPEGFTEDGYEIQCGTNHLCHALLTQLLLTLMLKTSELPKSDIRIINLTSTSQEWFAPKSGMFLDEVKTTMNSLGAWGRYGHSKVENVFYTKGLAEHYPHIKSGAIHPGGAKTGLGDTMYQKLWRSQLWASVASSAQIKSGAVYYPLAKEHAGRALINDPKQIEKLWAWTETELKLHGY